MTAVALTLLHIWFGHVAAALNLTHIWFGHVTAVKYRYIAVNVRYFGNMSVSSVSVMLCNSRCGLHCQWSVSAGSVIIIQ